MKGDVLDRAIDLHMRALSTSEEDTPRLQWRLSSDTLDELGRYVQSVYGWAPSSVRRPDAWMLGWPIVEDAALPPHSMLLGPLP